MKIPFNKPSFAGRELEYIRSAVHSGKISGDGLFTKRCQRLLERKLGAKRMFLTTSCTDALELAALLLDLKPGDEVLAPSFTFASTVNAFLLRGAKPVFIDIRRDTKNLDETLLEPRVTRRTKAAFLTHYGGVACEMDAIRGVARRRDFRIVEDAAHALDADYRGKPLGTLGTFGCFSFHETKNVICGEGGALAINDARFVERAEILREKGTDRSKQVRGEVDKYTWRDLGSSFLPSDILAAFLYAQLEKLSRIGAARKALFTRYARAFADLQRRGRVELPSIPKHCRPGYHLFYLMLEDEADRDGLIAYLKKRGILSVFHYLPLHSSPMGRKLGYRAGDLPVTEDVSRRLVRLPFYNSLGEREQDLVIAAVRSYLDGRRR